MTMAKFAFCTLRRIVSETLAADETRRSAERTARAGELPVQRVGGKALVPREALRPTVDSGTTDDGGGEA